MHTIKSVGVLSVAKVMGAIHALLALLFLPFALLIGLLASMAPQQNGRNPFGPFMGIAFAISSLLWSMAWLVSCLERSERSSITSWQNGLEGLK